MQSINDLKYRLEHLRQRARGDALTLRMSLDGVKEQGHALLSRPETVAASFCAGWWFARWSLRPKQIKQAKNVTIKKASFANQVLRTAAPFVFAELRSSVATDKETGSELE